MNVREERERRNCSGRGSGLAGAAISVAVGVGVGAALYYFLNKRTENNPDTEGSTYFKQMASEESFVTISEHDTTDTSILSSETEDTDNEIDNFSVDNSDEPLSVSSDDSSDEEMTHETGYMTSNQGNSSSPDVSMDWEATDSSVDYANEITEFLMSHIRIFAPSNTTAHNTRLQQSRRQNEEARRLQAFRERSWSLEECSICFDVILKDQEVLTLPCTHNFHSACIMPWLEQRQTCPNCRKSID